VADRFTLSHCYRHINFESWQCQSLLTKFSSSSNVWFAIYYSEYLATFNLPVVTCWWTSNVTSITKVRSASARLFAGTWCPLVSIITTLLRCNYFSSSSVVLHAFPTLWVYLEFGHQHHPLGNCVPNFVSFAASIAGLAHGENSHTQSLTNLFEVPGTEALNFGINNILFIPLPYS